jgi:signal transduction histidine kinase
MSIRLRLAFIYSVVLCLLAALVVGAIYLALAHALANEPAPVAARQVQPVPGQPGTVTVTPVQLETAQRIANESALYKLRTYSLAALLVLFAASFGIGWMVAGYLLRPIGRITGVAREITATDLSRRIDLGGPDDELRRLGDTFDDMLGRLDDAFANQRRFIQEASHELRNPLAVIRTNLEVTLADPAASRDDLRHTSEVVQRSTERMSRLVDDLLLYARNETPALEHERIDAAVLVRDAAEEFQAPAEARGLHLVWSALPGLLTVGDRDALRQALANLLANATRLAPAGSTLGVRAGREGPWVWLAVDDQGPGIAPEDQAAVFQRFWRGPTPSGDPSERRSGLGLTIVRQVVQAHGGEVKLVSAPGVGSTFALWLPAADQLEPGHRPAEPSEVRPPNPVPPASAGPVASAGPAAPVWPAPDGAVRRS